VRWRDAAGRNRARVIGRKKDAELFEGEIRKRKRMGTLASIDAGAETLNEYVVATWLPAHAAHLAERTCRNYVSSYDRHIAPRLGGVPLREIDSDLIAVFQGELLRAPRPGARP
jgi:hypothetical protein